MLVDVGDGPEFFVEVAEELLGGGVGHAKGCGGLCLMGLEMHSGNRVRWSVSYFPLQGQKKGRSLPFDAGDSCNEIEMGVAADDGLLMLQRECGNPKIIDRNRLSYGRKLFANGGVESGGV